MPTRRGAVHVVTTTRQHKGKTYHSHLLCRSYREGPHVRKETVGNLSHLPDPIIALIRRALRVDTLVSADQFEIVRSRPPGDGHAVLTAMERPGFSRLLSARRCLRASLVTTTFAA